MNRLIFSFYLIIISASVKSQERKFFFTQNKMGSYFNITLYANDSMKAADIAERSYQLVDSFVNIYSDYIDSSELNRLSARSGKMSSPFTASPALFDILYISQQAWIQSRGCFDISIGQLSRLWRKARKEKQFPSPESVSEKHSQSGFQHIILDTTTHEVRILKAGIQLDLGGIAQGYIAQKVIDRIKLSGIQNALVDVSGDISVIGTPPGRESWKIGINSPEVSGLLLPTQLNMTDKSVTSSGDLYQYLVHDGKIYSHIIDPRTGYGITSRRYVTVIANDCITADWLTKACSLLPYKKAKRLAYSLGADFMIIEIHKNKTRQYFSNGFSGYMN